MNNKLIKLLAISTISFGMTYCTTTLGSQSERVYAASKESKINKAIAKDLKLDQGFANGDLDENGNSTDNGTPDDSFAWAIYIKKITYSDNSLRIHVERGFENLNKNDRRNVIEQAMRASYSGINKYKKLDQYNDIHEGLYTDIFLDDTPIGHSILNNHYKFKWYE